MKFITKEQAERIEGRMRRLYGERAPQLMRRFVMMMGRYGVGLNVEEARGYWDENDCVLITYADTLRREGEAPLVTLARFAERRLKGAVSTIHLLPFYPWSSDDGFSVIDYRAVRAENGRWEHIERLGGKFRLMFDLVLNHCSRESQWFRDFVIGIAPGRFYFLPTDPEADLSAVVRPRPWPLLTRTSTRDGDAWVWTTFSEDQVDLNWRNPDVLFEFLDILFWYLAKGARMFRLDAVAFLWKEVGTSCLHLPQTHEVVKLFRDVLEVVAPDAVLLTETNVPHEENISYFGDGDEAHMVYNFSLPPLLLHGLLRNDASRLTAWARGLPDLPRGQAFLNFTASHDGIGVRPLQGLVDSAELDWLVGQVKARGGRVSMKANADGTQSPYELNITYRDALSDADEALGMARFFCSQAVALSLRGVPAVYIHSLLGTPNYEEGVARTGQNRSINRRAWDMSELEAALGEEGGAQARIHARYLSWLRRRANHPAFHPDGAQEVLDLGPELFGFVRTSPDGAERIVCVFNFTARALKVPLARLHADFEADGELRELLSGRVVRCGGRRALGLQPYHAAWLALRR